MEILSLSRRDGVKEVSCMNESETVSKRIEWVDIAKGIAIILVCLGHRDISSRLYSWIYSFHMPLFFFLAGYVTKFNSYTSFRAYAVRKVRVLLIPYFALELVKTLFDFLVQLIRHEPFALLERLGDVALGVGRDVGPMWFVPSLFVVEIVSYGLNRLPKWKLLAALILCLGGYALSVSSSSTEVFWNLNNALTGLFFFWFAHIFRGAGINRKLVQGNFMFFFGVTAAHALCLAVNPHVNMAAKQYGFFPIFLIEGIAGTLALLCVCVWLERLRYARRVLVYLGGNTLLILAFHDHPGYLFVEKFFNRFLGAPYDQNVYLENIEPFLHVVCVLLLCVPIIEFVNRFTPWIVGKKRVKRAL